jgi:hypothetical protein
VKRAVLLLALGGCTFGSEAAFYGQRTLDTCDAEIPVCNTTAGCRLVEEDTYTEGEFPGLKQMVVPTEGEAIIRVEVYWREQLGPGADTEILWNEPACVEVFSYQSQGANVFEDTDAHGVFVQEKRVFRRGDHLVEIRSDATGSYLIRTTVLTPDEYELEQAGPAIGF